jgi:hypothetical protein
MTIKQISKFILALTTSCTIATASNELKQTIFNNIVPIKIYNANKLNKDQRKALENIDKRRDRNTIYYFIANKINSRLPIENTINPNLLDKNFLSNYTKYNNLLTIEQLQDYTRVRAEREKNIELQKANTNAMKYIEEANMNANLLAFKKLDTNEYKKIFSSLNVFTVLATILSLLLILVLYKLISLISIGIVNKKLKIDNKQEKLDKIQNEIDELNIKKESLNLELKKVSNLVSKSTKLTEEITNKEDKLLNTNDNIKQAETKLQALEDNYTSKYTEIKNKVICDSKEELEEIKKEKEKEREELKEFRRKRDAEMDKYKRFKEDIIQKLENRDQKAFRQLSVLVKKMESGNKEEIIKQAKLILNEKEYKFSREEKQELLEAFLSNK